MMAAMLFRGVRLVHVPTSLMSMLDSVLSLKQAINSNKGKNLIGVLHPPTIVLTSLRFLESLDRTEVVAGLCEVVKNLLVIDPQGIEAIASHFNPRAEYLSQDFERFILHSIAMKQHVMEADPFEKDTGLVLEYGHTIGHAIEIASAGKLSHGLAVGLGMLCVARISRGLGYLSDHEVDIHSALLDAIGAPTRLPADLAVADILAALRFDNKRGYLAEIPGSVHLVMLKALGSPLWTGGKPLTLVPEAAVEAALEQIK
jgi:3-dehydroquinate synthase/2-deoxy-scyllo-inosose synthase